MLNINMKLNNFELIYLNFKVFFFQIARYIKENSQYFYVFFLKERTKYFRLKSLKYFLKMYEFTKLLF